MAVNGCYAVARAPANVISHISYGGTSVGQVEVSGMPLFASSPNLVVTNIPQPRSITAWVLPSVPNGPGRTAGPYVWTTVTVDWTGLRPVVRLGMRLGRTVDDRKVGTIVLRRIDTCRYVLTREKSYAH